jgi:DNA-binding NarL/FixJ family response regulator
MTVTPQDVLTDRELEVLRAIASGQTDHEVAEGLVVSVYTVKTHVRHILAKLEVRSRFQATDLLKKSLGE